MSEYFTPEYHWKEERFTIKTLKNTVFLKNKQDGNR